jgi:hypothetical protein
MRAWCISKLLGHYSVKDHGVQMAFEDCVNAKGSVEKPGG